MTQIAIQDGTIVVRDGKIGTSASCCCQGTCDVKEGESGGSGVTENTYLFPSSAQTIKLAYEAYSVKDRFIVSACGTQYIDTGEVSGSGTKCFLKPAGCTSVSVRVEGPNGTAWVYELSCDPCTVPPPPCDPPCADGEVCCNEQCSDSSDCCDPPCDESNCERCVETNGVWGCESTCSGTLDKCCSGKCKDDCNCGCACYSGFESCGGYEDLSYDSGCNGALMSDYAFPCFNLVYAGFGTVAEYFGTASQGYPFGRQWLKDSAVSEYGETGCSFALMASYKFLSSGSRCMRDGECICLNGNSTDSTTWYVFTFNCITERWENITGEILTENRDVNLGEGQPLGPANNCFDCVWDNGNPPPPPLDPGPPASAPYFAACGEIVGGFP